MHNLNRTTTTWRGIKANRRARSRRGAGVTLTSAKRGARGRGQDGSGKMLVPTGGAEEEEAEGDGHQSQGGRRRIVMGMALDARVRHHPSPERLIVVFLLASMLTSFAGPPPAAGLFGRHRGRWTSADDANQTVSTPTYFRLRLAPSCWRQSVSVCSASMGDRCLFG